VKTDFENLEISIDPSLIVGEQASNWLNGAQLNSNGENSLFDPDQPEFTNMPFEEKLRLADVMIIRWQRYRDLVIEENTILG